MKLGTRTRSAAAALIAVGCALALGSGTAFAESACKGMAQDACEKAADCIWVGGYEKKDGKQVSGYCRSKSSEAAASEQKDDKAAAPKASGSGDKKAKDDSGSKTKTQ